jgi:hypothetical protein
LQFAPAVTGTFTNLPGTISPYTNLRDRRATILPAERELNEPFNDNEPENSSS